MIKFEGFSISGIVIRPTNEVEFWKARSEVERTRNYPCFMSTTEVPRTWIDGCPEFGTMTVMTTNKKAVKDLEKFCKKNGIDHHAVI